MQKNDEFTVDITDMGNDGEGIGHYEDMAFFIKGAVIGDRILAGVTKLKKTYGYARVIKILIPSENRTEPVCEVTSRCGGCQLQSLKYETQLEYKENKVRECLIRLGGVKEDVIFERIIGMDNPWHYRNKAQFPVGTDNSGHTVMGFYAGHTHSIADTNSCAIQHKINDHIISAVKQYMTDEGISAYDEEKHTGIIRHVLTRVGFVTGEVMVCMIINANKLPKPDTLTDLLRQGIDEYNSTDVMDGNNDLSNGISCSRPHNKKYELCSVSFNINPFITNTIMSEKTVTVYGRPYISDYIGNIEYRISARSFFQVNPVQTKVLYSKALEFADLTGNETVWDLYCGIGTISLFLAQKAGYVYGVEIIPQAIEDAKENARLNGIMNAEFFTGAAEEILPAKYSENPEMRADVIVVDPPRKGCDESLLLTMVKLSPKRIVYVSCDPATLARDVKYLEEHGYKLKKVQPVDMFPMSGHVECVTLLQRIDT